MPLLSSYLGTTVDVLDNMFIIFAIVIIIIIIVVAGALLFW